MLAVAHVMIPAAQIMCLTLTKSEKQVCTSEERDANFRRERDARIEAERQRPQTRSPFVVTHKEV